MVDTEQADHEPTTDVGLLRALAADPDVEVRRQLAFDLCEHAGWERPTDDLVRIAVALTSDPDPRVRDWACFSLGTQWCEDVDSTEVRDALAARLHDPDDETRCEALLGLAHRSDPRALPHVRAALSRPDGSVFQLELAAAAALADPSLHPLVLRHQDGWTTDAAAATADAARRATDPDGVGDDVLDGVAGRPTGPPDDPPSGGPVRGPDRAP